MSSPAYYGMDPADLSTVSANPSIYSGSDLYSADTISQVANTAGQWGATIASIVTGNPVATAPTATGYVPIGAAGSTVATPMSSRTTMLLLLAGIVVVIILMKEK